MRVKLMFFATLRDRAGTRALELEVPEGMTVLQLKERIAGEYPALRQSMEMVLTAVNREYAFDEAIIPPAAEIAMFPPVSGGSGEGGVSITSNRQRSVAQLARKETHG